MTIISASDACVRHEETEMDDEGESKAAFVIYCRPYSYTNMPIWLENDPVAFLLAMGVTEARTWQYVVL